MLVYTLALALVLVVGGSFGLYFLMALWPKPVVAHPHRRPGLYVFFVPALNEELVIANTIESLLALPAGRTRIVVIDDASDDDTAQIVNGYDDPRVTLLQRRLPDARQGKGAALNHAYHRLLDEIGDIPARDVVVGVVDSDGRLTRGAIEVMDGLFSDRGVGAVQTLVRIINRSSLLGRFQDYEFVAFGSLTQAAREKIGSVGLGGNGQFTRLSALQDLGPEPWSDCLTEDLDLGIRLAIAGWGNRYTKDAWVEQQGLTDIRRLTRQRTRWCQGHFQCWRLMRPLISSDLPTRSVLDFLFYLLTPALTLLGSVVFVAPFFLLLISLIVTPARASWQLYVIYLVLLYLVSFGPSLLLGAWYWRQAKDISISHAFVLSHGLAAYNLIWYVAEWRALARIAFRRNSWAKTARLPESPEADGSAAT